MMLIEILQLFPQVGITCRGKSEEGILATSMLSTVLWLLQCYLNHLNMTITSPQAPYEEIGIKCVTLLTNMLGSDFTMAMLYLAKHDDRGKLLLASLIVSIFENLSYNTF